VALEGDLALFGLSDVLQVVAQQRKTGILTVQGKADILAVSFLKGEIVAADALNQSFEGLLGDVLASRGTVSADRFALLADRQRASGDRLIDFLVKQGIVGREELLDALRELTYRLLVEVLRWREGQFKFYGGEEVAYEEGIDPLRVDEVLMRALRDGASEPGRGAEVPHGYLAYTRLPPGREIREIPAGFDESTPLDPAVVWLTPEEAKLLERLDGRTPAESLARDLGIGEAKTYFALHRLLQAGLARPARDGEPPPGPRLAEPPAAAPAPPRAEALRVERSALRDLEPPAARPHPLRELFGRLRIALPVVVAALLLVLAVRAPGRLLFPTPELSSSRESFDRLRRLSRHDLIDRAARTYHLLEGRYPASLGELVERRMLPARAQRDPGGATYRISSKPEEYQLFVASEDGAGGSREGVFGDFLLDRELFVELKAERGVPLVLID
jgi:hypothetical protein